MTPSWILCHMCSVEYLYAENENDKLCNKCKEYFFSLNKIRTDLEKRINEEEEVMKPSAPENLKMKSDRIIKFEK